MPSWNIHLAVAKKVNKKYNLEKNSFYLGNTLPDVNYEMIVKRKDTHFYNIKCEKCPKEILPNPVDFLKIYKDKIKNSPLLLGYYSHILTDYYYNNYIFTNCWVQNKDNDIIGIKLNNGNVIRTKSNDNKLLKYYKHQDLESYGKFLFKNNFVEIPQTFNYKENDLDLLKNKFFNTEDVKKRMNYLNNDFIRLSKYTLKQKIFGIKYKMLTKEELDKLFNDCINFVIENINKVL